MNAQMLMLIITEAQKQVLEDGYKQASSLEAMEAYDLAGSNLRVFSALEWVKESIGGLEDKDIPDFVKVLKTIVGDK